MRKLILSLYFVILLVPSFSFAAPFLVCDPQSGVTNYKLTGPSWVLTSVSAQPDGSIKMDVSGSTVGSNSLTIAACKSNPIWGEMCSSTVPFTFTRPGPPGNATNTKLSTQ